jgi:hypothetical protein
MYGGVFVMAAIAGAETWQVAAVLMLGALGIVSALSSLSLAEAWVDERRGRGDQ